jgi:dTDP-3,4-didehydro-2,6-dideoxy-alpha-D-glucose 3-reductase
MTRLRFGIIGCGNIAGKSFIPALLRSEKTVLVSVASRDINKAKLFSEKFFCEVDKDYVTLIEREDIDAVYISTIPSTHEEIIILAAKNGKHVLCEKPLSTNYSSVEKVTRICRDNNVGLLEGYMYQYHSQHKKVVEIINQNHIGIPKQFTANFGFPSLPKSNYRYNPQLGGGACLDAGVYTIHSARHFFKSEPKNVYSTLFINENKVDTHGSALLNFGNGESALLSFGFNYHYRNTYMIWGTEGSITVKRAFSIPDDLSPLILLEKKDSVVEIECEADNQFLNQIDYFSDCIGDASCYELWRNDSMSQFKIVDQILTNAT